MAERGDSSGRSGNLTPDFEAEGKYEQAEDVYQWAFKSAPNNPDVLNNLPDLCPWRGIFQRAALEIESQILLAM